MKRRIAVYYMQVTPAASRVEMHFSWLSHPPRAYGDVNLALSVSTQRRHAASYLAGRAVARRRRGILETRVVYEVKEQTKLFQGIRPPIAKRRQRLQLSRALSL